MNKLIIISIFVLADAKFLESLRLGIVVEPACMLKRTSSLPQLYQNCLQFTAARPITTVNKFKLNDIYML